MWRRRREIAQLEKQLELEATQMHRLGCPVEGCTFAIEVRTRVGEAPSAETIELAFEHTRVVHG